MGQGTAEATPFIHAKPERQREWLLALCAEAGGIDVGLLAELTAQPGIGGRGEKAQRPEGVLALERRWYASIEGGQPDYGVYGTTEYLAELWGCYLAYSRYALQQVAGGRKTVDGVVILEELRSEASKIVDVGCGYGFTTAGLAQVFPQARVFGTNLPDTAQWRVAQKLQQALRTFQLVETPEEVGAVDLVFASEYFEHFPKPVAHLQRLISIFRPKAWLIGNSFTALSIGHFPAYEVNGQQVPGNQANKAFNTFLRLHGYQDVETTFWNQRPTYWRTTRE